MASPAMDFKQRQTGEFTIVELSGRLTVNDDPGMLREAVADTVAKGARQVLLDLSGVNYIDSTRLGELISAHVSLMRQGGILKLVATPGKIRELLHVAGLDSVFRCYETLEDAMHLRI
jgi:anti-sigma B factor antagonist